MSVKFRLERFHGISYPLIKFFSGRGREANWLTYVVAGVLIFYFSFVRSKMG